MWINCKHCCYLHGFELKSVCFPIRRAWDHDDSGLVMVVKRVLKDTKMTVYGISTHSTLKGSWHKHIVSTGMAFLCLLHEHCVLTLPLTWKCLWQRHSSRLFSSSGLANFSAQNVFSSLYLHLWFYSVGFWRWSMTSELINFIEVFHCMYWNLTHYVSGTGLIAVFRHTFFKTR